MLAWLWEPSYNELFQVENQIAAQKADHQRYVRENEELTRRLKKFVERLDNDKSDLFQQLLEEKRFVGRHTITIFTIDVKELLKKTDMDPNDPKSYRPIANLSVLSKLFERLVARQLLDYLNSTGLLPPSFLPSYPWYQMVWQGTQRSSQWENETTR